MLRKLISLTFAAVSTALLLSGDLYDAPHLYCIFADSVQQVKHDADLIAAGIDAAVGDEGSKKASVIIHHKYPAFLTSMIRPSRLVLPWSRNPTPNSELPWQNTRPTLVNPTSRSPLQSKHAIRSCTTNLVTNQRHFVLDVRNYSE